MEKSEANLIARGASTKAMVHRRGRPEPPHPSSPSSAEPSAAAATTFFNRLRRHFPPSSSPLRRPRQSPVLLLLLWFLLAVALTTTAARRSYRENRRRTKAAIAALVSDSERDVSDLCVALESLRLLPDALAANKTRKRRKRKRPTGNDDLAPPPAPVLVFHEGNLSESQREKLIRCAAADCGDDGGGGASTTSPCRRRQVSFPVVDFESFPDGFDAESETPNWSKRSKWGYHQMIRFWITGIWEHDAVQQFDTIMRLDSDSCYTKPLNGYNPRGQRGIPTFDYEDLVYWSDTTLSSGERSQVSGLWQLTEQHVRDERIVPANPRLWTALRKLAEGSPSRIPAFRTHHEVSRVSFMQRDDVRKWHRRVTESEPFGVFRERWGDAPVRFVTMALFAPEEGVVTGRPWGYEHKCPRAGYEEPLSLKAKWLRFREILARQWSRLCGI